MMSTQASLLLTILLLSLTGGWHCAGMCGAISGIFPQRRIWSIYQLGRLVSYLGLGVFSGLWGHRLYMSIPQGPVAILATVLVGVLALLSLYATGKVSTHRWVRKLLNHHSPSFGAFMVGLGNGLLPCHFLYTFLAIAASTRSPAMGAASLGILWASSSGYFLAFSWLSEKLWQKPHLRPYHSWLRVILSIALLLNLAAHWLPEA